MLDPDDPFDKLLELAGPRPKRVRLRVAGTQLEQTSWTATGKPKVTSKAFDNEESAREAFRKAVRKKLREDYVHRARPEAFGDVILEAFAPGGGGGPVLDLSLDGRFLATASITSSSDFGAKLEVVEVATGARRVVVDEPAGVTQYFLHAALFDRAGTGLYYALRDDLWHVELASLERRVVVRGASPFNSHVLRPSFDRERRRLVTFAEQAIVRVLDERGATLLEVSTASPTTECRAAAISPSGRLLALYIVNRHLVYGHADAAHDTTNEVQIWDIEAGVRWETVVVTDKLHRIGLAPGDDLLLVTHDYSHGPLALEIPSGTERWRLTDPTDPAQLALTNAWAFSPDGKLLACCGAQRLSLYDATTLEPIELPVRYGGTGCPVFSADGMLLAAQIHGTAVVHALDPQPSGASAAPQSLQ